MTNILCMVFFFSGMSALIFEVIWFQFSGLAFGNSVWATAIVLSSFMCGLSIGNAFSAFWGHRIKSPILFYAYLEIAIAVSGCILVLIFPELTRLFSSVFRPFMEDTWILNALRAVIVFVLMLIPTTAMGATLPVLVKALYAKDLNFGKVLGALYGWNTLGAMAGVITSEIIFIKWFGLRTTGFIAMGLNISAAMIAIWLSRRQTSTDSTSLKDELSFTFPIRSLHSIRLIISSFLSGMVLLALEVIWFRFMILFFVPTSWNFSIMLTVVLSGISLGGIFASRLFHIRPNAYSMLTPVFLINAILITLLYTNFGIFFNLLKSYPVNIQIIMISVFLMGPISIISGIAFTMMGKALHVHIKSGISTTGLFTMANTIGGMTGSIVAGLFCLSNLGIEKSFFLFSIIYALIALLVLDRESAYFKQRRLFLYAVTGTFLFSMILFPFGTMEHTYLDLQSNKNTGEKRVAFREGYTETIQYLEKDILSKPYYHRLVTNSHSMSGTNLRSKRYMKFFVYLPVAIQPESKNALLICFGCGTTAKALTDTKSLKNIDIVDISKDIIEMSDIVFPDTKENPVYDPRVKIHIEDGRFFLLATNQRYDIITAEPPPPTFNGVVNLYSQEYFQLIYNRLNDSGVVTYWLPVYNMKASETKSVLKAFCNVFENCSLWTGAGFEWMMVGVKRPRVPVSESKFVRQWQDPVVGPEMKKLGFDNPDQMGSFFIADGQRLDDWISDSLPLIDNYPQRLSSRDKAWSDDISIYRDFMDFETSRKNFIESEPLSKIWPETIRTKTNKYFASRQVISTMLEPKTPSVFNLHRCLHDPLLENYILWAFLSDHYAQAIIEKEMAGKSMNAVLQEEERIIPFLRHLSAGAAQEGNYLLADQYLSSAVGLLSPQNTNSMVMYYSFRIYLQYIMGQKEKAGKIARQYIQLTEKGKQKRKQEISGYWAWLQKNITVK